mgnify:CR=1 FL=1
MMHYKGLAKLAAKEAKNRALLICETAGMLSLLGEKWAYSAQVESLQQSDGRELLAEKELQPTDTALELAAGDHCGMLIVSAAEILCEMMGEK